MTLVFGIVVLDFYLVVIEDDLFDKQIDQYFRLGF